MSKACPGLRVPQIVELREERYVYSHHIPSVSVKLRQARCVLRRVTDRPLPLIPSSIRSDMSIETIPPADPSSSVRSGMCNDTCMAPCRSYRSLDATASPSAIDMALLTELGNAGADLNTGTAPSMPLLSELGCHGASVCYRHGAPNGAGAPRIVQLRQERHVYSNDTHNESIKLRQERHVRPRMHCPHPAPIGAWRP